MIAGSDAKVNAKRQQSATGDRTWLWLCNQTLAKICHPISKYVSTWATGFLNFLMISLAVKFYSLELNVIALFLLNNYVQIITKIKKKKKKNFRFKFAFFHI